MTEYSRDDAKIAPEQIAVRAKCFHPTGKFLEFRDDEVEQSILDRFDRMVRLHPQRLAVKSKTHSWTYESLNRIANHIARAIAERRDDKEESVALLLEHSAEIVAAIFAIWKCGKIYVPLEPTLPCARNNYILDDTRATLIVTNTPGLPYATQLQSGSDLINIDELDCDATTENISLSVSPDHLAYILYTSGSAGQPKGVVQNHRNLLHQTKKETNSLHICVEDRLVLLRSCSAIGGIRIILSGLLNGATVYPFNVKEEGQANLTRLLLEEEITIYDSAASMFRHFADSLRGEVKFPDLRLIRLSSEPVYLRDVELYKAQFSQRCIFVNSLGVTETTGSICSYFIDHETRIKDGIVPVGYALEDTEILLLDDLGAEVSFENIGEIAVRSRYLAQGYWRQPELTTTKFLFDKRDADKRVYFTGDLAQLRPDGCLVHLGRKDFQANVRGYQVDTTEIERVLADFDAIKEATVVVREDRPGEHRVVAYLVPAKKTAVSPSDLRRSLAETLPAYMIPSTFMLLDAMPLTPTGKVDRAALPPLGRERPNLATPFADSGTFLEETLVRIWSEVLSLDRVGTRDNFFDLGGDSLLLARIQGKLRDALAREVTAVEMLKYPNISALAAYLSAGKDEDPDFEGAENRADKRRDALARMSKSAHKRKV